jgi:hypothetical protein
VRLLISERLRSIRNYFRRISKGYRLWIGRCLITDAAATNAKMSAAIARRCTIHMSIGFTHLKCRRERNILAPPIGWPPSQDHARNFVNISTMVSGTR